MTSEKRAQKFHTDDALLPRSGWYLWLAESNFPSGTTNGSVAICRPFSQAMWNALVLVFIYLPLLLQLAFISWSFSSTQLEILHPTMSSIKTGASCMHISHQSNKYLKIVQNVFSMWDFLISRMSNINISFQVIDCCLIYDIIRRLVDTFSEQDVELLLLVLKSTKYDLNCITLEVTSFLLPFIFLWSLEITPSSKMVSTFHHN